jgi:hypothetical protein
MQPAMHPAATMAIIRIFAAREDIELRLS